MRVVFLAVILAGCVPSAVGQPCTGTADCGTGLACVTTGAPGGFCTRGCTEEGAFLGCPTGSICIAFGHALRECVPTCTSNADCRVNYQCDQAGGVTATRGCRPEGTY